ncbi:hypothetical protein A9Q89_08020 [Gammaproteobacteria bacterium 53_120_T64]|nr:hypothetical protein A9Q89_08020 [Gammaproteobacteria bacterium 53_120_T64]
MSRVAAGCPSCQSVFFVSAAQGKVANNLVRCGRCGHLFSVVEHLTQSLPEPEEVLRPAEPETPIELQPVLGAGWVGEGDEADLPAAQPGMPVEAIVLADAGGSELEYGAVASPGESFFVPPNLRLDLGDDFELTSPAAVAGGLARRVALAVVIVSFALIGLAGQFVVFQLPALSQTPEYRPWLQGFCRLLSCQLAAYAAPSLVRVEHLQVRDHPDLQGSLLVELVLTNTAPLEQAFPVLILSFDELSGRRIAARRLVAAEYLPKSIDPNGRIPVNKAVRIRLGILDPGARALSYAVVVAQ